MPIALAPVLRIVAAAVFTAGVLEYLLLDLFLLPPFLVSALLLGLSFLAGPWPRPTAAVCLVLGVLIPIAAVIGYLNGDLVVAVPIFDAVVFAWLFFSALRVIRGPAAQQAVD